MILHCGVSEVVPSRLFTPVTKFSDFRKGSVEFELEIQSMRKDDPGEEKAPGAACEVLRRIFLITF